MNARIIALVASVAVASPSAGCMTYLVHSEKSSKSPHTSPISIGALGLVGDGLVAGIGGGMHAADDEGLDYQRTIPVWFAVLAAADLVVFLVSLDRIR